MLKIRLEIKPLSVNAAYQGRRFSTPAKNQYDKALQLLLPRTRVLGDYYKMHYRFYLKNFGNTDSQNLLKVLTDNIVKRGIIKDDRFVIDERVQKFRAAKDRIEVDIEATTIEP